ncbi:hypothetical protein AAGF08_02435 [Algoriphagus sp. SE2]
MASPKKRINQTTNQASAIQQEKVKIEPEALPEAVKTTIAADEKLKSLSVLKASQITQLDRTFHFEVIFENGTEEKLIAKFDQNGIKIID